MNKEQIIEVLTKHRLWLNNEESGVRADLKGVNLARADLTYANLAYANLARADLEGVNLTRADLEGVNLADANLDSLTSLWGATGNRKEIKSLLVCETYPIVYTHQYLQIGCERHLISDWREFSDERIAGMGDGALEWWKKWKELIFYTIDMAPATPF